MKKYIGTDITADGLQRLTTRLSSGDKLPRNITLKDIQAVYTLMANHPFSPKEAAQLIPNITLKKVRYCVHFMLRYDMLKAYRQND